MDSLFLKLLNMSITGGLLVPVVLILRLCLKKMPKWISCALWALVLLRLVLPVSFSSNFSLLAFLDAPAAENGSVSYVRPAYMSQEDPLGIMIPAGSENAVPNPESGAEGAAWLSWTMAGLIWAIGAAAVLIYGAAAWLRLRRRLQDAVLTEKGIFESDRIASAFLFGLLRPRIYLPVGLSCKDREFVLRHERAHLRCGDHISKPLAFLVLALHWFNPLVWLSYYLLCRDLECRCDERVIRDLDAADKAAYGETLLRLATGKSAAALGLLAFGESGTKARIKRVLNYKKPSFWLLLLVIVLCIGVGVFLLADPIAPKDPFAASNGSYRAGELLGQKAALSWRPEDGSDLGTIKLQNFKLSVIGSDGEVFESDHSSVTLLSRQALLNTLQNELVLMDESLIPDYRKAEDMAAYSYYSEEDPENPACTIWLYKGEPIWYAEGFCNRIYRLEAI